jgi:hypothetical protein
MSQFNSFMQSNILVVITGVYPDYAIDFTKLVVTKGTLTGADDATATAIAGHKVTVAWADNTGTGDALATDKAMLLILNKASKKVVQDITTKTRMDATIDLTVPLSWVGQEVFVYLSFVSEAGNRVADSTYIDAVTILA